MKNWLVLETLFDRFDDVEDPRVERGKLHSLRSILGILLCANVAGITDLKDVVTFANIQIDWLRSFLPLENGIPCVDTFRRVLRVLNPKQIAGIFSGISEDIRNSLEAPLSQVAIDGKTVRGSRDGEQKAIHSVSAYCTTSGLVLAQIKTDEKSNEITAIPELLDLLSIEGTVVTIDAMGCQKEIAAKIIEKKGDYYLPVKLNQPSLFNAIDLFVQEHAENTFCDTLASFHQTTDNSHGRLEIRRHWSLPSSVLALYGFSAVWRGLKSIGIIEREIEEKAEQTTTRTYYISSRVPDAQELAQTVRDHWGIESFHWILDVHFREDASRIRKDHGPENMAIIRRIAYNLVKAVTPPKQTFKSTKLKAMLSLECLKNILLGKNP